MASTTDDDVGDVQSEIDKLQNVVRGLQLDVDRKQNHFRNELQQIGGSRFRDVICIPPLVTKTSVVC